MDKIRDLKSEAYDILAIIEAHQNKLRNVNQQIIEEMRKQESEPTKDKKDI